MKRGRNGFRGERNKRAAYAGETGAGLKVADTGLDRGNDQGASCRVASRVHVVDGSELDGIAESRARAVRLYGVNVRRRKSGRVEGALQEGCLGVTARRRKTARSAVLVDGGSPHDSQDPVPVPFRLIEFLQNQHHATFRAHVAVGVSGKGLAPAIRRHEMRVIKDIVSYRGGEKIYAADKSQIAFAVLEAAAGCVQGEKRGRAGAVNGHARSPESVKPGEPVGRYAVSRACAHVGVEGNGGREAEILKIGSADARKHASHAAAQGVRRDAGPLKSFPGDLQKHALLGIDFPGLAGGDAEEGCVKRRGIFYKTAETGFTANSAPGDRVRSGEKHLRERFRRVGAGKAAGEPDDGHGFAFRCFCAVFPGRFPGEERGQFGDIGAVIEESGGKLAPENLLQFPCQ